MPGSARTSSVGPFDLLYYFCRSKVGWLPIRVITLALLVEADAAPDSQRPDHNSEAAGEVQRYGHFYMPDVCGQGWYGTVPLADWGSGLLWNQRCSDPRYVTGKSSRDPTLSCNSEQNSNGRQAFVLSTLTFYLKGSSPAN